MAVGSEACIARQVQLREDGVVTAVFQAQARREWYVVVGGWHPDPLRSPSMFPPQPHWTTATGKMTQPPQMSSAGLEAFHWHLLLPSLSCHVPRGSGFPSRRAEVDTVCSAVRAAYCSGPC